MVATDLDQRHLQIHLILEMGMSFLQIYLFIYSFIFLLFPSSFLLFLVVFIYLFRFSFYFSVGQMNNMITVSTKPPIIVIKEFIVPPASMKPYLVSTSYPHSLSSPSLFSSFLFKHILTFS